MDRLPSKIMSIDCETNGLWGKFISISFVLYDNGVEIKRWNKSYIDSKTKYNDWVKIHVLPYIEKSSLVDSYYNLLSEFSEQWYKYKDEYTVVWFMGQCVESRLFYTLYEFDLMGEFDGPYDYIELATLLCERGHESDNLEYFKDNGFVNTDLIKYAMPHNSLYDAIIQGQVYNHLQRQII